MKGKTQKNIPITFIIFILITFVGCDKVVEESELNYRNDKYYPVNSETPYTGRIVSYYENGQVESSINYKKGVKDGISEHFYENGQLQFKKIYRSGKFKGTLVRYNETGNEVLILSFNYDADTKAIELLDDSEVIYQIGGKIVRKGVIRSEDFLKPTIFLRKSNEEPCNVPIFIYSDGNLTAQLTCNDGIPSYEEEYDLNGMIIRKLYFDGFGKGVSEHFIQDNVLNLRCNFANYKLNGRMEYFYEDGSLKSTQNYVDDEQNGLYKEYYKNGQLRTIVNFKYGEKQGLEKIFNKDGTLESSVNWMNGVKVE